MKEFYNYEQIMNYVNNMGVKSLEEIGEAILNELLEYVDEKMGQYIPKEYERTGQFRDSFTVKILKETGARQFGVYIYVDTSKIIANKTDVGKWNQHMSLKYQDVSKFIPLWMDSGHGGVWKYNGMHWVDHLKSLFTDTQIINRKISKYFNEVDDTKRVQLVTTGVTFSFK